MKSLKKLASPTKNKTGITKDLVRNALKLTEN